MTPKCPACHRIGGAINASPHCPSPTCTWNKCRCGATYHRTTMQGFTANQHYPMEKEAS